MVGFGPADLGSNPSRATSYSSLRSLSLYFHIKAFVQHWYDFMEQVDESPPLARFVE